ncbi:MAG: hypothetical protein J7K87_04115 [Candidatus Aenigmarchaeota archaeon]|nr:hypothetical protein [Candidatus Aenigmarchaeota archaeon]
MVKICLACSAGGHLKQLLELDSIWKKYDNFIVTYERENTKKLAKKREVYIIENPERDPFCILKSFIQSLRIFLKEKPDLIVADGAGISIPISIVGKIFRRKLIFIESFSRITEPSMTGRILYPFADLFLVQWKPLLKKYGKKAIYSGGIF